MKPLLKIPLILTGIIAAGAAALLAVQTAQASGGWGFGMAFNPPVVASCTSYNLIPLRVDVPKGKYAGYATGRLSNERTGTIRKPAFGVDTIYNVGSPTVGYLIFNPPEGSVDGDVFHVSVTLSSSPSLTPTVGSFEFSYRCSTGEVIYTAGPTTEHINTGYGDSLVLVTPGKDAQGNPEVDVWCLDPQGYASSISMTLSKATLAGLPAWPATNTLIDQNNSCTVHVAAYILTTGEYQVTIGPDPHGVINQVVFTGLEPANLKFMQFNQNQQ